MLFPTPSVHPQARHRKLGGPRPALRVVSYNADTTNRSPTFDLDLCDLFTPGDGPGDTPVPVPYTSLRQQFKRDPATSWGAYVAGCVLVLAHEKGCRFEQGISLLISSDVPEGGVPMGLVLAKIIGCREAGTISATSSYLRLVLV